MPRDCGNMRHKLSQRSSANTFMAPNFKACALHAFWSRAMSYFRNDASRMHGRCNWHAWRYQHVIPVCGDSHSKRQPRTTGSETKNSLVSVFCAASVSTPIQPAKLSAIAQSMSDRSMSDRTSDPELFDAHCHLQVLGLAPCGVPRYMPTCLICASMLSDKRMIQGRPNNQCRAAGLALRGPPGRGGRRCARSRGAAIQCAGDLRGRLAECESSWSTLSRVRLSLLLRPPNATVVALRLLRDRKTATP